MGQKSTLKNKIWYAGAWRSKEQVEARRAADRERYRYRYKNDPRIKERAEIRKQNEAFKESERERSKRYYRNNTDRVNSRRKKWSAENRERERETRKKNYTKNSIYKRVIRQTDKLERGSISVHEFIERIFRIANESNE